MVLYDYVTISNPLAPVTHQSHLKQHFGVVNDSESLSVASLEVPHIIPARVLEAKSEFVPVASVHPDWNNVLARLVRNHQTEAVLPVNSLSLAGLACLQLPVSSVPLPDDLLQVLHAHLHLVNPLFIRHGGEG